MSRVRSAYSNSERAEQDYIKHQGEAGMTTIIDTWMDGAPTLSPDTRRMVEATLRTALAVLTDLEAAEWAASLCGNVDFQTWLSTR